LSLFLFFPLGWERGGGRLGFVFGEAFLRWGLLFPPRMPRPRRRALGFFHLPLPQGKKGGGRWRGIHLLLPEVIFEGISPFLLFLAFGGGLLVFSLGTVADPPQRPPF